MDFPWELLPLSREDSWSLFRDLAIDSSKEITSSISDLAEEIVDDCKGNPLALNLVGRLLRFKNNDENECMSLQRYYRAICRDSDYPLWCRHGSRMLIDHIFRNAWLSYYYYLPSHLKISKFIDFEIGLSGNHASLMKGIARSSDCFECRSNPDFSGFPRSESLPSSDGGKVNTRWSRGSCGDLLSLIYRFPPNFARQLSVKARRNCSNIGVAQVVVASWLNNQANPARAAEDYVRVRPGSLERGRGMRETYIFGRKNGIQYNKGY